MLSKKLKKLITMTSLYTTLLAAPIVVTPVQAITMVEPGGTFNEITKEELIIEEETTTETQEPVEVTGVIDGVEITTFPIIKDDEVVLYTDNIHPEGGNGPVINDDNPQLQVAYETNTETPPLNDGIIVESDVEEEEEEPQVLPPTEPRLLLNLSDSEKEVLCRIVEAEVTGESYRGVGRDAMRNCKFRVARVIINRVLDGRFPNTVSGVVFDRRGGYVQFTPTSDGRYYSVNITGLTREAVENALNADIPDDINGALYFMKGRYGKKAVILRDEVGHRYYK